MIPSEGLVEPFFMRPPLASRLVVVALGVGIGVMGACFAVAGLIGTHPSPGEAIVGSVFVAMGVAVAWMGRMRSTLTADGLAITELTTTHVPLAEVVAFYDAPKGNKGHVVWVKRANGKPLSLPSGPFRPQVERQVADLNAALDRLRPRTG